MFPDDARAKETVLLRTGHHRAISYGLISLIGLSVLPYLFHSSRYTSIPFHGPITCHILPMIAHESVETKLSLKFHMERSERFSESGDGHWIFVDSEKEDKSLGLPLLILMVQGKICRKPLTFV